MTKLNQKGIISGRLVLITLIVISVVGFAGWKVYQADKADEPPASSTNSGPVSTSSNMIFASQKECEEKTSKVCSFQQCDFVPEGKTFEEVCGKDFKKGWVSIAEPILTIGNTVTVRGVIDENVTKHARVDGEAYLRLGTKSGEIRIVYHPGDAECINPLSQAFNLNALQKVEVSGKVIYENTISTCESKNFYIKVVDTL